MSEALKEYLRAERVAWEEYLHRMRLQMIYGDGRDDEGNEVVHIPINLTGGTFTVPE